MFEPVDFSPVYLSVETVESLTHNPVGKDLVRLNRLLLEDTLPGVVRKSQKRWIRFLSWCGSRFTLLYLRSRMFDLRDIELDSELYGAARPSLIRNERARKSIASLLDSSTLTSNYLVNAGSPGWAFTRLDIYAAKTLALIGEPTDIERLVELANRPNQVDTDKVLAVKELSLIDKGKGIQATAACLAAGR